MTTAAVSRKQETLGVIAGRGALPRLLVEAEKRRGGGVFVVAIRRAAEDWVQAHPHCWSGLGQVGRIFSSLNEAGCDRVAFAGGVVRPGLLNVRFDLTAFTVAAQMARLLRGGDDGLLRGIAQIFEERGFRLVAPHEILKDLLAPEGVMGKRRPSAEDMRDIERAAEIVTSLGTADVGQAAVVAQGRCLGLETVQGTDAMLQRLIGDNRRAGASIPSGTLYKAPKPQQDWRLDLPAIGPQTLKNAKDAGLNGVAVQAGGVFLLDVVGAIEAADKNNLFLYGLPSVRDEASGVLP